MTYGEWYKVRDRLERFHGFRVVSDGMLIREHGGGVDWVAMVSNPDNPHNARPGDVYLLAIDTTPGATQSVEHLIRCCDWLYADDVERAIVNYTDDVLPALLREARA